MHEVVTLSCGQYAGWLNAAFYNCQRDYFVYSDEEAKSSQVDPKVRWVLNRQSLAPRAVFWDLRGSFGKRRETVEGESATVENASQAKHVDEGSDLNTWLDTMALRPAPKSLHEISDWVHSPSSMFGTLRGTDVASKSKSRGFQMFDQGVEAFEAADSEAGGELFDLIMHGELEKCDNYSGACVVTDFSGWAGWTTSLLAQLRDEVGTKKTATTWAADWGQPQTHRTPEMKQRAVESELRCWLGLSEFSSILLPLSEELIDWESQPALAAARTNVLYETVMLLPSLRGNARFSMESILAATGTEAPGNRNIFSTSITTQSEQIEPQPVQFDVRDPWSAVKALEMNKSKEELCFNYRSKALQPATHVAARVGIIRRIGQNELTSQQVVKAWDSFEKVQDAGCMPECDFTRLDCTQYLSLARSPARKTRSLRVDLDIDDGVTKLRSLVPRWAHDLRDEVYTLTEPYHFVSDEHSDFD